MNEAKGESAVTGKRSKPAYAALVLQRVIEIVEPVSRDAKSAVVHLSRFFLFCFFGCACDEHAYQMGTVEANL